MLKKGTLVRISDASVIGYHRGIIVSDRVYKNYDNAFFIVYDFIKRKTSFQFEHTLAEVTKDSAC